MRITSQRTYARSIATYLNLLHAWGVSWDNADPDDIADVREFRLHSDDNVRLVGGSTWEKDLAALRSLYREAALYGIPNPIPPNLDSQGRRQQAGAVTVRRASVKWFQPAAVARWRDVGLLGMLPDGTEDQSFRSRSAQRNAALTSVLYRTGLRVQEAGSVLLTSEWPEKPDPDRQFTTLRLAAECAKGGRARSYWLPRVVRDEVAAYVIGERAASVRRAQTAGRYESDPDRRIIVSEHRGTLTLADNSGKLRTRRLDSLGPLQRRRLYRETNRGLEPAMLWLNVDGTPRRHESWNSTFELANRRVRSLGLDMAQMRPHYLRHSFALRWYVVARLLWQRRELGLSRDDAEDLRDQMGSHWTLVQTMLGHRNPQTTMGIYLEPFVALDVELLLDFAADDSVNDLMAAVLSAHPRVQEVAEGDW